MPHGWIPGCPGIDHEERPASSGRSEHQSMKQRPLAARVSNLRPTAINRVLREVRQVQEEGRSVVSLLRGQPDTPTPAHIVEAAERALRHGRTGYADNQGEPLLRLAVA